jgi:hypothetical protein
MLAGKIFGAYSVTPAEPVSNTAGISTNADPTEVSITVIRGTLVEDWLGYKLRANGLSTVVTGEFTTGLESGEPPPPPPQALRSEAHRMSAREPREYGNKESSLNYEFLICVS